MQQNQRLKPSSIIFFMIAIIAALMIITSCHEPKSNKVKVQSHTTQIHNENNTSDVDDSEGDE